MSGAIIGNLSTARNIKWCIEWPDSENLLAVLKGQLLECLNPSYWDSSTGDVSELLDLLYDTLENNLMPTYCAIPGEVRAYAGQPNDVANNFGWLLCSGQCLLQSEHPELFEAIGTTWGDGGNPATQFQVPALNGRVIVGWAGGVGQFSAVGETGGSATHTLTNAESANHNHAVANGDGIYRTAASYRPTLSSGPAAGLAITSGAAITTVNPVIGNSGGGGPHNNVQPYATLTYMIYSGRAIGTGCQ